MGNIRYRENDWDAAESCYQNAWRLAKLDKAKTKLDRVKEMKKKG